MSTKIKAFFLEETNGVERKLRRYRFSSTSDFAAKCSHPGGHGYHDASVLIEPGIADIGATIGEKLANKMDPRWPKACACGYVFQEADEWQVFMSRIMQRVDTGEKMTIAAAPPGAMWYADWYLREGSNHFRGPDGHCLVAKCPDGHHWIIDSRCSNCGSPADNVHKCWVRHGDPRTGNVHVDKNGVTCAAGGGSIQTETWHGFLHNGYFES